MSAQWPSSQEGGETSYPSGSSSPVDGYLPPRTPHISSNADSPLLPPDQRESPAKPSSRSFSSSNFVSSPLNPNAVQGVGVRSRPGSRGSTYFNRIASEESQALTTPFSTLGMGQRGSMVLYRLAGDDNDLLLPPKTLQNRESVASSSGDSVFSLSSDSKYPSGIAAGRSGFVPYAYDPDLDEKGGPDEDDFLHSPENDKDSGTFISWRGFLNVGVLVLLIAALLALFICYPVVSFYRDPTRNNIYADGNTRTNSSSIEDPLPVDLTPFTMPQLIDPDTPESAKTRTGFDGQEYELVFSDEFNVAGRTFYPGDDPFWEAVDLWYGSTADQEWYDPKQIVTKDGYLSILMEQVADQTTNHMLPYRSGMLQSWNKFCFSSGYIEVSVTMPGPDSNTQGYWPGAWTMGNLGRPGYGATADGAWPYSYNECDLGTFPNQTLKDRSGPAAALHSDSSRSRYNYELSWLPGQRLSACTCPGEDHPGPSVNVGRGAPEIDVFEVERNKTGAFGQVTSQSAQFAPFSHDYIYQNDTQDKFWLRTPERSTPNPYRGSAVQQAVSVLTNLPDDMFQGSGQVFHTLGFEYWADPDQPLDGFITWQVDGTPSYTVTALAVGPDQGDGGSMVGQRRIPEEPMAIVLNLGISSNWQPIDLSTMIFPAEMRVDYVRVYQRSGSKNVGCNPARFPTSDYINNHIEAYTNPNFTFWSRPGDPAGAGYSWPKNSLYDGC